MASASGAAIRRNIELAVLAVGDQAAAANLRTEINYLSQTVASYQNLLAQGKIGMRDFAEGVDPLIAKIRELEAALERIAAMQRNDPSPEQAQVIAKRWGAASRGVLEFSRAMEDFSLAGWRGALNNVPMLVDNMGRAFGMSNTAVNMVTASVSLLATGLTLVYNNWNTISAAFQAARMDSSGAGGLFAWMATGAQSLGHELGKITGAVKLFRNEAADLLDDHKRRLESAKQKVKELAAEKYLDANQIADLKAAKKQVEENEEAVNRLTRAQKLFNAESKDAQKRREGVQEAVESLGGGGAQAREELRRALSARMQMQGGNLTIPGIGGVFGPQDMEKALDAVKENLANGNRQFINDMQGILGPNSEFGKALGKFTPESKKAEEEAKKRNEAAKGEMDRMVAEEMRRRTGDRKAEMLGVADLAQTGATDAQIKQQIRKDFQKALMDDVRSGNLQIGVVAPLLTKMVDTVFDDWKNQVAAKEGDRQKAILAIMEKGVDQDTMRSVMSGSKTNILRAMADAILAGQDPNLAAKQAVDKALPGNITGAARDRALRLGMDEAGRTYLKEASEGARVGMTAQDQAKDILRELNEPEAKRAAAATAATARAVGAQLLPGLGAQAANARLAREQLAQSRTPKRDMDLRKRRLAMQRQQRERQLHFLVGTGQLSRRDVGLRRATMEMTDEFDDISSDEAIQREQQRRLANLFRATGARNEKGKVMDRAEAGTVAGAVVNEAMTKMSTATAANALETASNLEALSSVLQQFVGMESQTRGRNARTRAAVNNMQMQMQQMGTISP